MELIANSIKIASSVPQSYFNVIEYFLQEVSKIFDDNWVPCFNNFIVIMGDYIEEIMKPEHRVRNILSLILVAID